MTQPRSCIGARFDEGATVEAALEVGRKPAYLHRHARIPRRIDAATLLSPFDSVVWERSRNERLFDFHYRIEIYTPQPKRIFVTTCCRFSSAITSSPASTSSPTARPVPFLPTGPSPKTGRTPPRSPPRSPVSCVRWPPGSGSIEWSLAARATSPCRSPVLWLRTRSEENRHGRRTKFAARAS